MLAKKWTIFLRTYAQKNEAKLDFKKKKKKEGTPKKMCVCLLGDPDPEMRLCGLFLALETKYLFTFVNQLKCVCRQFGQISLLCFGN